MISPPRTLQNLSLPSIIFERTTIDTKQQQKNLLPRTSLLLLLLWNQIQKCHFAQPVFFSGSMYSFHSGKVHFITTRPHIMGFSPCVCLVNRYTPGGPAVWWHEVKTSAWATDDCTYEVDIVRFFDIHHTLKKSLRSNYCQSQWGKLVVSPMLSRRWALLSAP